jgi:c(7)-type cytochrome triheme protein
MTRSIETLALAVLLLAGTAGATDLPNLPQALPLPQGGDSPGEVTFRHESHVDGAKPACLACHPGRFPILGRSAERRTRIVTHAAMEKGESCGACHGKQAFGFDDCTSCHAQ